MSIFHLQASALCNRQLKHLAASIVRQPTPMQSKTRVAAQQSKKIAHFRPTEYKSHLSPLLRRRGQRGRPHFMHELASGGAAAANVAAC